VNGLADKQMSKPLSLLRWYGGKHYLAGRIVSVMSQHRVYVEPYGGAAAVLLNKLPSEVEVYNDLDGRLVRIFRVLRDHPEVFLYKLALTPYAENEWQACHEPSDDEVEQARRDYVLIRQSFAGRGESFAYSRTRSRSGMADVVSGFLSAVAQIPQVVERLRRVQIMQREALEVIALFDSPETLFYCDPPYLPETVKERNQYLISMSRDDHERLLEALLQVRGKVILSGYPSPLYDEKLSSWYRLECDIACHAQSGKQKQRKTEVLWLNYPPKDRT